MTDFFSCLLQHPLSPFLYVLGQGIDLLFYLHRSLFRLAYFRLPIFLRKDQGAQFK